MQSGGDSGGEIGGRDPLVGAVLADRYEILSVVGRGGMSVVYRARHRLMGKIVALKVLLPHLVANPQTILRFQQEARALSRLNHPNVINVLDFGVTPQGEPFLVMEFLEGESLAEALRRRETCLDDITDIFIQTCRALEQAHEQGVIHRDLKPGNIMLTLGPDSQRAVKIVDFGIAKLLPLEGSEVKSLTQTGEVFGSPLYMSPEQCTGQALDARSDIYSLGCVMYEALAGRAPLEGKNIIETIYKHLHDVPPPLRGLPANPEAVEHIEKIVYKAMAKDPAARYQTARELRSDLESLKSGEKHGLFARLTNLWTVFRLKNAGRKKPPLLSAAFAAAAVGLVGLTLWLGWDAFLSPPASPPEAREMRWFRAPVERPPTPDDYEEKVKHLKNILRFHRNIGSPTEATVEKFREVGDYQLHYHFFRDAINSFEGMYTMATRMNLPRPNLLQTEAAVRLGDCYYALGQHADALKYYEENEEAVKTLLGRFEVARVLGRMGEIYAEMGQLDLAASHLSRALKLLKDKERTNSLEYVYFSSLLADCYRHQQQYQPARLLYEEVLSDWKTFAGTEGNNVIVAGNNLGVVCREQGDGQQAVQHFREALSLATARLQPGHRYTSIVVDNCVDALRQQHRWLEAVPLRLRKQE